MNDDMLPIPTNRPSTEYKVGIGWVLPVGRVCAVCGDESTESEPHPVPCCGYDRHPSRRPTTD